MYIVTGLDLQAGTVFIWLLSVYSSIIVITICQDLLCQKYIKGKVYKAYKSSQWGADQDISSPFHHMLLHKHEEWRIDIF